LKTNRAKAVIFVNIYSLALFFYTAILKHTVNSEGVNALDICLIRVVILITGSVVMARTSGASFWITP